MFLSLLKDIRVVEVQVYGWSQGNNNSFISFFHKWLLKNKTNYDYEIN